MRGKLLAYMSRLNVIAVMGRISVYCKCGYVYMVSQGSLLIYPNYGRIPILLRDGGIWTHKLEEFDYSKSVMGRRQEFKHKREVHRYFKVKALLE